MQAAIDLLFLDLVEGRFGAAERAWPGLRERAEAMKGWHQWLMIGRLAQARAEIALGLGRPEAAAEAAVVSIAHARRVGRLKYEVASRTVLGAALLAMGKPGEAVAELRRALAGAERLRHPPSLWRAAAELGAASYSVGDDHGAAAAYRSAHATIDSFAKALALERRQLLLAAEPVRKILGVGR